MSAFQKKKNSLNQQQKIVAAKQHLATERKERNVCYVKEKITSVGESVGKNIQIKNKTHIKTSSQRKWYYIFALQHHTYANLNKLILSIFIHFAGASFPSVSALAQ